MSTSPRTRSIFAPRVSRGCGCDGFNQRPAPHHWAAMRTPRLRVALYVLLSALVAVHALATPSHLLNRRAVPVQDRTHRAARDTAAPAAAPFLGANSVALVPGTPWIMGNMTVTTAVTMALRDLQHDWYKVLGLPPVRRRCHAPVPHRTPD